MKICLPFENSYWCFLFGVVIGFGLCFIQVLSFVFWSLGFGVFGFGLCFRLI